MPAQNSSGWLRAIGACAFVIVMLPAAFAAGLLSKGRKCSPEELASELKKFATGAEGETDWDRLESVPMRDPRLEAIRQEAMTVNLPLQAEDRAKLGLLAAKVETLSSRI
jgi:hypothetical protein